MMLSYSRRATDTAWRVVVLIGLACLVAEPAHTRAEPFLDVSRAGLRVLSPLDGTWFDGGNFDFHGEGFSNWQITPQLLDRQTGEWVTISSLTSDFVWEGFDDNPQRTDPGGYKWYRWHASAHWNTFDSQWAGPIVVGDNQQRGAQVELRFVNANNGDSEPSPYAHFARNAGQCISMNEAAGLQAVLDTCALPKDSVTYTFKCGRSTQACCAGSSTACDGGLVCTTGTCRQPPPVETPPEPQTTKPSPPRGDFDGDGCELTGTTAPTSHFANNCGGAGGTITHGFQVFSTQVNSGATINVTLMCSDGAIQHAPNIGPGTYTDNCAPGATPYKSYCGRNPVCATRRY